MEVHRRPVVLLSAERCEPWRAQRETKRQRLRRALAHQRLGLPPPAGGADLEVERGAVPAPGTAAHRDAFDAALGRVAGGAAAAPAPEPRGAAGGGHAAARVDDDASGTDASAEDSGSADEEGPIAGGAAGHGAAPPPAASADAESAAERLQRQSATVAAARAELRLAASDPGGDPGGGPGDTPARAGSGSGIGGSGSGAAGSGGDAAPASAGVLPTMHPARVVHLKACDSSVVPAIGRNSPCACTVAESSGNDSGMPVSAVELAPSVHSALSWIDAA